MIFQLLGLIRIQMKDSHRGKVCAGNHLLVLFLGNSMIGIQPQRLQAFQEIDSPELVIGNDEESELCFFSNEQNRANDELEETNSMVSEENCECQIGMMHAAMRWMKGMLYHGVFYR